MTIKIVCAGKMKEKYLIDTAEEYIKRLSRFSSIEICEVPDESISEKASEAEELAAIDREGIKLLSKIRPSDYVIALTIDGKSYDSISFASHLQSLQLTGKSSIVFVIGGSLGLSSRIVSRADECLSLSRMTFPHRLARILILEQVYRAFKINANETYHK